MVQLHGHSNISDVIGRIKDGVLALDGAGRCTYLNKKAAEILGLALKGAVGTVVAGEAFAGGAADGGAADGGAADGGERAAFYQACRDAISSQQYQCSEAFMDDQSGWIEYHIYPSPTGISALFRDINGRKVTEEELKRTELRFRALIEQASDAIMITDDKGHFLDVNPALCKLFGYTREELMRLNINHLIDPEQLKDDPIQFDVIKTGRPLLRERRMLHKDGSIIEVEANVKLIPDGRLLAIARDITERKKAAQQIVKEKEISESIINSLPGIFLLREYHGRVLRWNKRLETITGYNAGEIAELKELEFFEEKDKAYLRAKLAQVFAEGSADAEAEIVTKDGRKIPFYITSMAIDFEGKPCYIALGFDISELKRAEKDLQRANEQLHHLSDYLQNVREEERKGIAREIHDELGQQLTGLKMDIAWGLQKCKMDDALQQRLSGMSKIIDQTIVMVRRISSELRPSILDDLGLSDALDWQCTEFEKRYHIESRFESTVHEIEVSPGLVTGLFRIYQESLTNVARHAHAKKVRSSLALEDDHLVLQVADDGRGFDSETVAGKKTFGLLGIRERTLMMGGQCTISSSRNQGTTIKVSVPMTTNH
jgi:PAS domain S-box-containing protein